uniref:Uncharacterized protein n=1 Tax=Opuntia streptacantha TaxID=393608 RepID=A0A7C8YMW2_OPUST
MENKERERSVYSVCSMDAETLSTATNFILLMSERIKRKIVTYPISQIPFVCQLISDVVLLVSCDHRQCLRATEPIGSVWVYFILELNNLDSVFGAGQGYIQIEAPDKLIEKTKSESFWVGWVNWISLGCDIGSRLMVLGNRVLS